MFHEINSFLNNFKLNEKKIIITLHSFLMVTNFFVLFMLFLLFAVEKKAHKVLETTKYSSITKMAIKTC